MPIWVEDIGAAGITPWTGRGSCGRRCWVENLCSEEMDSGVKELDLGHRNCVDCVKDYDEVWVPMWLVEGIERNEVTFLFVRASKVLLDWAKSLRLTYPWASRACWW